MNPTTITCKINQSVYFKLNHRSVKCHINKNKHTNSHTPVQTYTRKHIPAVSCTYTNIHIHIYTYIYTHIFKYIYTYTHIHIHTYIYQHIHIYICTHTYTHIHVHIQGAIITSNMKKQYR